MMQIGSFCPNEKTAVIVSHSKPFPQEPLTLGMNFPTRSDVHFAPIPSAALVRTEAASDLKDRIESIYLRSEQRPQTTDFLAETHLHSVLLRQEIVMVLHTDMFLKCDSSTIGGTGK